MNNNTHTRGTESDSTKEICFLSTTCEVQNLFPLLVNHTQRAKPLGASLFTWQLLWAGWPPALSSSLSRSRSVFPSPPKPAVGNTGRVCVSRHTHADPKTKRGCCVSEHVGSVGMTNDSRGAAEGERGRREQKHRVTREHESGKSQPSSSLVIQQQLMAIFF